MHTAIVCSDENGLEQARFHRCLPPFLKSAPRVLPLGAAVIIIPLSYNDRYEELNIYNKIAYLNTDAMGGITNVR